ncbi:hypothetical protein Tco_1447464 [Tanacetum coccineum]
MASMIIRLNIRSSLGICKKHGGSKQVGFKQLGLGVETGVHGVHDEKHVWFEVELQGAQGDRVSGLFRSTQQCTKSGVAKHLGVAGLQQQNGLVKETNVTLLAKVLQGDEFRGGTKGRQYIAVELMGMSIIVDGDIEVQIRICLYYHPARDREQHSGAENANWETSFMKERKWEKENDKRKDMEGPFLYTIQTFP